MPDVRYTLADGQISTIALAEWVKEKSPGHYSAQERLEIARQLKRGSAWEPVYWTINDPHSEGPCSAIITPDPDPYAEMKRKWIENSTLLEKACNGDAEAAFEYCRKVKSGEINHAASGGFAG